MTVYPHWRRVDYWHVVSEEERAGVPDFKLARYKEGWRIKWRTSATWVREAFPTLAAAKAHVKASLRGWP